jgi:hypothetical protein
VIPGAERFPSLAANRRHVPDSLPTAAAA